jgi:hypothetical protein
VFEATTPITKSEPKTWKLRGVIDEQPCFSYRNAGAVTYVGLDIQHAVRDIFSSSSSSSSSRQLPSTSPSHEGVPSLLLPTILQHVLKRTWHASNAKLDAVQRAVAVHLVLRAHGYQLAGFPDSSEAAYTDPSVYTMTCTNASE